MVSPVFFVVIWNSGFTKQAGKHNSGQYDLNGRAIKPSSRGLWRGNNPHIADVLLQTLDSHLDSCLFKGVERVCDV